MAIDDIKLTRISESPTNPRKRFGDLEELAQSITEKGILQPVLCRPHPTLSKRFELVVGARRYRAAKIAKVQHIPAVVRKLADDEVLEIQMIENDQRADVHPLERAEGYEQLMKKHSRTVVQIAAKVARSESAVRASLKLLALCPKAREAFYDEKVNASVALLIARIPDDKLQLDALKRVEGCSYRDAQEEIEHSYMLRLQDADWKLEDAELVPEVGACTTCPLRTGSQPELFGDVKSADVCTSPPCFANKRKAWVAQQRKAGRRILVGKAAEKVRYGGKKGDRLVRLDHQETRDPKYRSHKKLAGKHLKAEDIVLVEDHYSHEFIEYATPSAIAAAKKANGWTAPKPASRSAGGVRRPNADRAKADAKDAMRQACEAEVLEATLAAVARGADNGFVYPVQVPGPVLCIIARELADALENWSDVDTWDPILQRRGLAEKKPKKGRQATSSNSTTPLDDWITKAQPADLLVLIVELLMASHENGRGRYFMGRSVINDTTGDLLADAFLVKAPKIRKAYDARAKAYLAALPKPKRSSKSTKKTAAKPTAKKIAKRTKATSSAATKTTHAKKSKPKRAAAAKPAAKAPARQPLGL